MTSKHHSRKVGWFFFIMILIGIASLYIAGGSESGATEESFVTDTAMAITRMFQFPLFYLDFYYELDFIMVLFSSSFISLVFYFGLLYFGSGLNLFENSSSLSDSLRGNL